MEKAYEMFVPFSLSIISMILLFKDNITQYLGLNKRNYLLGFRFHIQHEYFWHQMFAIAIVIVLQLQICFVIQIQNNYDFYVRLGLTNVC